MAYRMRDFIEPAHKWARAVRSSASVESAKAFLGQQILRIDQRDTLDVDLSASIGMGAMLAYAVRLHAFAEQAGKAATIVSTSSLYGSGEDVFGEYFERPAPATGWKPHHSLVNNWLLLRAAPWTMGLDEAHRLFNRHFQPKPVITQHIGEPFDLSVHFRGTDKVAESGIVAETGMLAAIASSVPARGKGVSIFLATDEASFANAVREQFDLARIASFNLGEVEPGRARHFSEMAPRDKALEALVNIFQIANARTCLRTSSYLSAISRIVNPELRSHTINVNRFSQIFPEDQIVKSEQAHGSKPLQGIRPC